MTKRATIYLRQSKDVEGTGLAVDRQLAECRALCERNGWSIVRTITDNDTSASSSKPRPGWRDLLADVEHGATDVVVAWSFDRLYRQLRDTADLLERCITAKVMVATMSQVIDPSSPADEFVATQLAGAARYEVRQKALRQQAQQRQAAERGRPPSRRAFGYAPGGMELDPVEAPVVREAFDRLFRGDSLVSITAAMKASGLVSVRGNQWSRKGVRYMLLSARYAGWREYHGGELRTRGEWPTIISDDEHEKAVALLTDPFRRPAGHRGTARRWLLSGLALCGRCGSDVRTGRRTTGARTYICRAHAHLSRAAEPVDELVLAVVEARLSMPDLDSLAAAEDGPELAALRRDAEVLRAKIARAQRDYDDELIDASDLRAVKQRRQGELAVVQRKITAAARSSVLGTLAASGDRVEAFEALDLSGKRAVIDTLCEVTLLPTPPGTSAFDPESVQIVWRGAQNR